MRARDVMTGDVVSVGPDTSIVHVAQIMLDRSVSGLPVIDDDGKLVGMITEGDLMRRLRSSMKSPAGGQADAAAYVKSRSWKTGDVMSRNVVTVDEDTPVGVIADLVEQHRIRRVPVMRDGKMVGVVSRADLLHAILAAEPQNLNGGDRALRLAIATRIRENAGIRAESLNVTVSDGIVHLWGIVRSEAERDAIRVVAETAPGTRGVQDHLRIAARVR